MENKLFLIAAIGFVLNLIIISFCTTYYIAFINDSSPLTHINRAHSVININGY
ncbi:MAG: hypothetical protein WCG23_01695 [bacterium]